MYTTSLARAQVAHRFFTTCEQQILCLLSRLYATAAVRIMAGLFLVHVVASIALMTSPMTYCIQSRVMLLTYCSRNHLPTIRRWPIKTNVFALDFAKCTKMLVGYVRKYTKWVYRIRKSIETLHRKTLCKIFSTTKQLLVYEKSQSIGVIYCLRVSSFLNVYTYFAV